MTESPDLPEDEQELLEAFARLAPEGSAEWNFENSMRRLSTPAERPTWVGPWSGLPADLWERGRATKASERVMGDVIKVVAQDLTDYTQQAVDELRRFVPEASAVDAAIRSLASGFDMLVTAEGVETREQYELLRAAAVDQIQGYLFGKPAPAEAWDFIRPLIAA